MPWWLHIVNMEPKGGPWRTSLQRNSSQVQSGSILRLSHWVPQEVQPVYKKKERPQVLVLGSINPGSVLGMHFSPTAILATHHINSTPFSLGGGVGASEARPVVLYAHQPGGRDLGMPLPSRRQPQLYAMEAQTCRCYTHLGGSQPSGSSVCFE